MLRNMVFMLVLSSAVVSAGLRSEDYILVETDSFSEELLAFNSPAVTHIPLHAIGIVNQIPQIPIEKLIKKGINLAIFGTVSHYCGFVINCIALPITTNKIRLMRIDDSREFPSGGLAMVIIGSVLSAVGPLPSYVGASLIEEAFEDRNISFTPNRYGSHYARSWAYEAAAWGIYGIGSAMMKGSPEKAGPIIIMVGLYLLEIAAEVHRGISAIGPIKYGKKAQRYLEKRQSVSFDFLPVVSTDGAVGMVCRLSL